MNPKSQSSKTNITSQIRFRRIAVLLVALATILIIALAVAKPMPKGREYASSIGIRLVRIEPGTFRMGSDQQTPLPDQVAGKPWRKYGDFDERPAHNVKIARAFYIGAFEVTNAEYEQFDPTHRQLRGKQGFSSNDDDPVVFVSWEDATRFCEWLSKKEVLPFRLPTEAEWEYAGRSGTTTNFYTGDNLPAVYLKNAVQSYYPPAEAVSAKVGQTPPNSWGLYDVHGNVEEWVWDWYGPYEAADQTDPVGRVSGDFKVTRGGSHSSEVFYLRTANRMGTLPEDKHGLLGFRVVLGPKPKTKPLPQPPLPLNQMNVRQTVPANLAEGPDPDKPYFCSPRVYVRIPPSSNGPLFSKHNHDPAIVECPNGDLLAIWYICNEETGRELGLLASRLRYGQQEWEEASPFWDAPDRNDHAPLMWFDGKDTIYQFNGMSAIGTYRGSLALVMRTSKDSGAAWSKARLIGPEHAWRQQPIESAFRAADGSIVIVADAHPGTAVIVSRDNGQTWTDSGGRAAGIHAGVVQLKDDRLMAFGRDWEGTQNINGMMPKSFSSDMGKTWTSIASPFPPIGSGQRPVLIRLREGPILFGSFAKSIMITDSSGRQREVSGLFGALSFDEGETWPIKRLITDDGPDREIEGGAWTGKFILGKRSAEPKGYMAVTQTPDGVIHLISSRNHYAFNLAWLKTPAPPDTR